MLLGIGRETHLAEQGQRTVAAPFNADRNGHEGTRRAFEHFAQHQALAVHDCFALALAEQTEDCILLTGDSALRRIASGIGIEVHGILWTIDELERTSLAPARQLYDALSLLEQDNLVFLPKDEIRQRLRRLRRSM